MRVKNIFKSDRLDHKDPAVRLQAIESLEAPDSEQQQALATLLVSEPEQDVRAAALQKLSLVEILLELSESQSGQPALHAEIEARLIQTLEASGMPEDGMLKLSQTSNDTRSVLVASHSSIPEQRALVIKSVTEDPLLLRILADAKFHDTRLQAAEKLSEAAAWKEGAALCKTRDKVVAKMLQARLDEQASIELAEKASHEEIKSTVDAMKVLATSVWSPQHAGKFQALMDKWVSADQAHTVGMSGEFDEAKQTVQAMLEEHQRVAKPSEVTAETNKDESATDGISDAANKLWGLLKPTTLEQLPSVLTQCKSDGSSSSEQGQALLAHAAAISVLFDPPFDVNKSRPSAIQERIKRVDTLLKPDKSLIPFELNDSVYIQEFFEHKKSLLDRLDKARQESQDRIKATHRQFGALNGLIASGKWGPANSMMQRLKKKLAAMEPAERSKFGEKLSRAEKQLDEMADWQDFAAKPKLELICQEMEALPAKSLKPPALAKEVKRLQESWKALGVSRASNDLWARFKLAGDTAYEPCKAFFEQKQAEREKKIDAKKQICVSLDDAFKETDWQAPDWKAIAKLVSNAKRSWSQNRVTDRKPDKDLEQRFSKCLEPIESKLSEQYDANAIAKKELIEKAKVLAEGEINQHSINQIKRLQTTWKQVGVMRRKEDQTLWEEFNGHCRTIFKQQRDAEREKYKASMGHVFRAKDIIKELRALSKSNSVDDNKLQELTAEFQALEAFPDKDKKFLLRGFRSAIDSCSKATASQSRRKAQAEQEEIRRQVGLCEQLETLVEAGNATDNAIEDIKHSWEASELTLGKEMAAKLVKRRDAALAHVAAGTQYDYDKAEEQRRNLLIKMEIAADIETPAEDKQRRMAYQLEHLRDGMTSSGVADQKRQLRDLEIEWFTAAPVKSELHNTLQSRYLKALGR